MRDKGAECQLEFEVESEERVGFMNAMQLGTLVEGHQGHMSANLTWPGPPEVERDRAALRAARDRRRKTAS